MTPIPAPKNGSLIMPNRTRTILLTAILALLVAAPVAAAKRTYNYTSTVTSAPVSTSGGYPNPGGSAVMAGTLSTEPFGAGAVIDHVTMTGQPSPNVFTFEGTEVDLFADGTSGNTFTGTATIQSDGSQNVVINGRLTLGVNQGRKQVLFGPGGTGRYRGATGSYTFHGTIPAGSNVITGSSSGTIVF